jgi:FlaA1/EpsC-like NDP-sugar epimerase
VREGIFNNVLGTAYLVQAAVNHNVQKFVLVSTDKAVNPTNYMGATKRIAEIICQYYNKKHSSTKFVTVRFGNVLGSAGSVVPIFQKQIERGGPITVTHPKVTRFFMTIPEAASLILQSFVLGNGGEIFVLDMGEPVKIKFLAEQMITLVGKEVGKDIAIEYTGLRPGEKLFEELFHESEMLIATKHNKILLSESRDVSVDLEAILGTIETCCNKYNTDVLLTLIEQLVPELKVAENNFPINMVDEEKIPV